MSKDTRPFATSNLTRFRFDGSEYGLLVAALLHSLPIGSVVQSPIGVYLLVQGRDAIGLQRLHGPCPAMYHNV